MVKYCADRDEFRDLKGNLKSCSFLALHLPATPDRPCSVSVKALSTEIWHLVCGFFSFICSERVEAEPGAHLSAVWLDRCGMALNPW